MDFHDLADPMQPETACDQSSSDPPDAALSIVETKVIGIWICPVYSSRSLHLLSNQDGKRITGIIHLVRHAVI
jgi:hypothetical protein